MCFKLERTEKTHIGVLFVILVSLVVFNVYIVKYWLIPDGSEYTDDFCRRVSCNFTSNYTTANGLFFVPTLNRSVEVTVYFNRNNRRNYCGYQGDIFCYYKNSDPDSTLKLGQKYMNSFTPILIMIDVLGGFGLITYIALLIISVYRRRLREECSNDHIHNGYITAI